MLTHGVTVRVNPNSLVVEKTCMLPAMLICEIHGVARELDAAIGLAFGEVGVVLTCREEKMLADISTNGVAVCCSFGDVRVISHNRSALRFSYCVVILAVLRRSMRELLLPVVGSSNPNSEWDVIILAVDAALRKMPHDLKL